MQQRVEAKRRNNRGGGTNWLLVLLFLILGFAGGFAVAFQIVDVVNANPGDLSLGSKRLWVEMTADSYALTQDLAGAQQRLSLDRLEDPFFSREEVASLIGDRVRASTGDLAKEQRLRQLGDALGLDYDNAPSVEDLSDGGSTDQSQVGILLMGCGAALGVIVLLTFAAIFLTRGRQKTTQAKPVRSSTRNKATIAPPPESQEPSSEPSVPELSIPPVTEPLPEPTSDFDDTAFNELFDDTLQMGEEEESDSLVDLDFAEPAPTAPPRYSAPLDEFITRYNFGDDGYDMSFSIETPQTEFLGECGVGLSETLNKGTPQEATAFEVWLFDKDDIRTVTKVLLSSYAWEDDKLRSRLAPKGDLVQAKPGEIIDLETKSLRVRARIREVEYGASGSRANAYFERLVIELTPQQKQ